MRKSKILLPVLLILLVMGLSLADRTVVDKFGIVTFDKDSGDSYNCPIEQISISNDLCYGGACDRLADKIGDKYYVTIGPGCEIIPFGYSYCENDNSADCVCSSIGELAWHIDESKKEYELLSPPDVIDTSLQVNKVQEGGDQCSSAQYVTGIEDTFYNVGFSDSSNYVDKPLPPDTSHIEDLFLYPKSIKLNIGDTFHVKTASAYGTPPVHDFEVMYDGAGVTITPKGMEGKYASMEFPDHILNCNGNEYKISFAYPFIVTNFKLKRGVLPSYVYEGELCSDIGLYANPPDGNVYVTEDASASEVLSSYFENKDDFIFPPEDTWYWDKVKSISLLGAYANEVKYTTTAWSMKGYHNIAGFDEMSLKEDNLCAKVSTEDYCNQLNEEVRTMYVIKGTCSYDNTHVYTANEEECKSKDFYGDGEYAGEPVDLGKDIFCANFLCHACRRSIVDVSYDGSPKTGKEFGPFCFADIGSSGSVVQKVSLTLQPGAYALIKKSKNGISRWVPGFEIDIVPDYNMAPSEEYIDNLYVKVSNEDPSTNQELDHPLCTSLKAYDKNKQEISPDDEGWYKGARKISCSVDVDKCYQEENKDDPFCRLWLGSASVNLDPITLESYVKFKMEEGYDNSRGQANWFVRFPGVLHEFDCFDGVDNDGDGLIDIEDEDDCKEKCGDGIDNDNSISSSKFVEVISKYRSSSCDYTCAIRKAASNGELTDMDSLTGIDRDDWKCHEYACTDGSDEYDPKTFPKFFNDNDDKVDGSDSDCYINVDFSPLYDYADDVFGNGKLKSNAKRVKLVAEVWFELENGEWIRGDDLDLGTEIIGNPEEIWGSKMADSVELKEYNQPVRIEYIGGGNEFAPLESEGKVILVSPEQNEATGKDVVLKAYAVGIGQDSSSVKFNFYIKDESKFNSNWANACGDVSPTTVEASDTLEAECPVSLEPGRVYSWYASVSVDGIPLALPRSKVFRTIPNPGSICYDYSGNQIPCSAFATKKYTEVNLVTLPLSFKYGVERGEHVIVSKDETLSEPRCGDTEVVRYYPDTDTVSEFAYLPSNLGYHNIPSIDCQDSSFCLTDRCIDWRIPGTDTVANAVYFKNVTVVNMAFGFDMDIDYDALVALYSSKDKVPMLLGRAI